MAPVRMLHDDTGNGEWATAYLTVLEAKGTPKEAHGSALFCLPDGPAELALDGSRTSRHTTRLANHWMTYFA